MITDVVHRAHEDHPLASARDPSGDALVGALLVAERYPDAHRCADSEAVAFDEHDRRPAGADPCGDVLGRACQQR